MFIFCFLYLWVLSYLNFFSCQTISRNFKIFENSTSPDKKNRGWNTSRPLFSDLLLIWFLHLLRRFQKISTFTLVLTVSPLVIRDQVFLLTIDFTAEAFFQRMNPPNFSQNNTLQWYPHHHFQLNIKVFIKVV